MAVLLVLCDPEDSERVANAIAAYGRTFRLSSSDCLLSTETHRDEVWHELHRRTDIRRPESLLLVPMQEPFRGAAGEEVPRRWMNQPRELAGDET
jgi:hypothetical protein